MTITEKLQDALAVLLAVYLVMLQTNLALALRSVVFGLIVLAALALVLRADARAEAALSPPARAVVLAFVAWSAWSAASIGWSARPIYSAGELKTDVIELAAGCGAMLLCVRRALTFRRFVATMLGGFAVLATAAIGMAYAQGGWNDKLIHHGIGTWSTHIVVIVPLIALVRAPPLAGFGRGSRATAAAVVLFGLALASARVSENRMVWPALIAALAVFAAAGARRWPERWHEHRAIRLAAVVALAALMAAAFVDVASRKAESTLAPPPSIGRSVAEDPRLAIWSLVRERIAERPWVGHGYGKEIVGADLASRLGDPTLTHAHNAFASVWLQTGAAGLALFLGVLIAAGWRFAGYLWSPDDALSLAGAAGLAILAGMIVKNLPDDFFVRTNARYFWTTLALLLAFGERRLRELARAGVDIAIRGPARGGTTPGA